MRLGVHYKATAVFGAVFALILCAIFLYLRHTLKSEAFARTSEALRKETLLAKTIVEDRATSAGTNLEMLDTIADEIGKNLNVRTTIVACDGTIVGDSDLDGRELQTVENHLYRPEVQDALKGRIGESRRFSTTIRKDMLYVAVRFETGTGSGVVRLSRPLSEVSAISRRVDSLLAVSLVVTFLAAFAMSMVMSAVISRPMRDMVSVAKSIASGDFSRQPSYRAKDEVGDLARALRHMSEQIRSRIQEVVASKSRLEAVLSSMFDGVMVVDSSGTIVLMNDSLRRILGVEQNPAGRRPLEVVRSAEIQDAVDSAVRIAHGVESRELSLLVPVEKTIFVHATPIIREGVTDGAVLVFHDISDLRRLERVRQDFVANISHELRTPISTIKGYAETLLDGALEDRENARSFLKIIHDDSERLAKLINDLLDLSRIESGRLKLDLQLCDIGPIVSRIVSVLRRQAEEKRLTLEADIPPGLASVVADEDRLAQVLFNLIDNAIKYTDRGGRILIATEETDGFVKVDVSDTGIGILDKDLPRVFERFYRGGQTHAAQPVGTGLGLSIVKHIVRAHNGRVSVRSTFGKGSTFSFTIPKVVP